VLKLSIDFRARQQLTNFVLRTTPSSALAMALQHAPSGMRSHGWLKDGQPYGTYERLLTAVLDAGDSDRALLA